MLRFGVSFGLEDIFFTHIHSDHILGISGLVRTMALQGRTERMRLWTPRGTAKVLRQCLTIGGERATFPIDIQEIAADSTIDRGAYRIETFAVDHRGTASLGYAIVEKIRLGRFNPELARELGIPEGPLWGKIHRGESVTLDDGKIIDPKVLVGESRRGRRVVITGDTRPAESTIAAAKDADLLVHEATFAEEECERAVETGHSTAREAAMVAASAGVRRLALTHISARYSKDAREIEREARAVFPNTIVARDGTEIDLPLTEETAVQPAP